MAPAVPCQHEEVLQNISKGIMRTRSFSMGRSFIHRHKTICRLFHTDRITFCASGSHTSHSYDHLDDSTTKILTFQLKLYYIIIYESFDAILQYKKNVTA